MVKVSVIQCTKRRLPHFEWALHSLKSQKYKDFEYLIIDGLYDQRKDSVKKLIDDIVEKEKIDFPISYLPDKASRWKGKRPALCNARNTGIIFAKGDYVIFHDDCCKFGSDWLEKHVLWLEKGYITSGSWIAYQDTDESSEKGIIGKFGWEYRSTIIKEPISVSGGWLYGANMGIPIKIAEDINGFDEYLDGEMGQDDMDFGIRAERKGYKIIYDPLCYVEYYYKDHGLLMTFDKDLNNDIWKDHFVEIDVVPINIKLKDGKYHFSNEFAMQELLEQKERFWTRGNTIQIKGTREIIKSGIYSVERMYKMMESWIDKNPYDWRDHKLITDKI